MTISINERIIYIPANISGTVLGIGKQYLTIELDKPIKRIINGNPHDQWIVLTTINHIKKQPIQLKLF